MKTLTQYDILVVVLNRLYLVLVIGLYIRYGYISLSTSRGAGNHNSSSVIARSSLYSYLSTSRGAGNTLRRCHGDIETNIVYLPIYLESGRKQIPLLFLDLVTVKYRYLSTSRGAGNVLTPSSIKAISSKYISLSTSRGAGNSLSIYPFFSSFSV